VATQWAAAMLDYRPALGAPLADLGALKLYGANASLRAMRQVAGCC
jgi:hypothetical protein